MNVVMMSVLNFRRRRLNFATKFKDFLKKSEWRSHLPLFLSILALSFAFWKMGRFGLPSASSIGHNDDQMVALGIFALLYSTLLLPRWLGRSLFSFIVLFIFVLTVSNWWFFEFYRDYVVPDTIRLAIYARETSMALGGLSHKFEAILFFLTFAIATGFAFRLDHTIPRKRVIALVVVIVSAVALQQGMWVSQRVAGGLKHRGENHVAHFFRNFFPTPIKEVGEEHLEALRHLYPNKEIASVSEHYPLFVSPSEDVGPSEGEPEKKNIIIIVMESLRAAESGIYGSVPSLTPHLDEISKEMLVASDAYANSNQTVRGELAIHCSALDYVHGSPASMAGLDLGNRCLPHIFADADYSTHWIHGYTKEFFNRENFFPTLGFQHIHDREVVMGAGHTKEIGWGVTDTEVFEYSLDTLEAEEGPFFAEIMMLSNHYPYLWEWDIDFPDFLPRPGHFEDGAPDVYAAYKRGIYYTDHALGRFWERFKKSPLYENTVVVFVADHGIWSFNQEITKSRGMHAEFLRNEMYFRIPLMIYSPNLHPGKLEVPVSQLDIAPTLLDLLKINSPNAFLGNSMLPLRGLSLDEAKIPVLFLAAGTFGFLLRKDYCFPIDTTQECTDAYRRCKQYKKSDSEHACIHSDVSLLKAQPKDLMTIESHELLDDAALVMELTQRWLDTGYVPPDYR